MSAFHVAMGALLKPGRPPPAPSDASAPASPEPRSPAAGGPSAAASIWELTPLLVPVPPELVPEVVPAVNEPEVKTPAVLDPEVTEPDVTEPETPAPDMADPEPPDPEPLDEPLWLPELVPVDTTAGPPLSLQPAATRATEAMMRVDTVVERI